MSDTPQAPQATTTLHELDRRHFVKTTAAAAAAMGGVLGGAYGQGVPADRKLKVGFIGCGGRGTGAASQALSADDNMELYAMADVFQDRIDTALGSLGKQFSGKINVP
ncbi:MAG: twin-arginine translocation signal domain-containing protein [Verrucomicrobiales bacterium]